LGCERHCLKRNQIVILVMVGALALMAWSGYQNFKRRRIEQQQRAAGVLVPDASNQTVGQDVADDEGLPNLRGKRAPEFRLRTPEGKRVSLAEYKGKAVLVNFWATWCPPCKVEIPWFVELQKEYGPQGFQVLGIDDDVKDHPEVAKFKQKMGINYPLLLSDDRVDRSYSCCDFLPVSYFVGRDGKIVAETPGLVSRDEIEANIKKALAAGGS
jgi:peroxiredoxin